MESLIMGMSALSLSKAKIIHMNMLDTNEAVQITLPRKRFYKRTVPRFDGPEVDEVEQGVLDWYAARGEEVPEADLAFMAEMKIATSAAEAAAEAAGEAAGKAAMEVVEREAVPPHGTPEFWAWCRRRKAAKIAVDK